MTKRLEHHASRVPVFYFEHLCIAVVTCSTPELYSTHVNSELVGQPLYVLKGIMKSNYLTKAFFRLQVNT